VSQKRVKSREFLVHGNSHSLKNSANGLLTFFLRLAHKGLANGIRQIRRGFKVSPG
jgi:hypothetical protein